MKVTVIGPWGGFPKAKEASSGYLFQQDGFNLLVDCGSGVLAQLQQFVEVEQLDAVILSHYHHDHVTDIGVLQYGRLVKSNIAGESLPILPIHGHGEDQEGFGKLSHGSHTKGIQYDPAKTLSTGPFSISFLKTKHPVPCYAMRITAGAQTVVYTADSSYIPELVPFSKNADMLICECNLYPNMDGSKMGHMNSSEAASIAKEANVGELILTHLPHFGDLYELVDDARRIFAGKVELAALGMAWGQK
jgi:ribonuclease BN (tRNA processing enzyme)